MEKQQRVSIVKTKDGKKSIYKTTHRMKGDLKKIIEYLKSDKTPYSQKYGNVRVHSIIEKEECNFERHVISPLPNSTIVNSYLGTTEIVIKYDIAHADGILISKSKNPEIIQGYFNYTELITITQDLDEIIFEREAIVANMGCRIPLIGHNFEIYDDHFNNQSLDFFILIGIEINK
jgi:hypothetical protein